MTTLQPGQTSRLDLGSESHLSEDQPRHQGSPAKTNDHLTNRGDRPHSDSNTSAEAKTSVDLRRLARRTFPSLLDLDRIDSISAIVQVELLAVNRGTRPWRYDARRWFGRQARRPLGPNIHTMCGRPNQPRSRRLLLSRKASLNAKPEIGLSSNNK